jgi:uncharacterized repeat protein (TIGR02543 family)
VSTASNHNLYAHWTAVTYTVTFNPNGGGTPSPASKSVTFADTYGALPVDPGRTGYTFAGWFTAPSAGTQITAASAVSTSSDHTLYAQWTAATGVVLFNANGGGTPSPASNIVTFLSAYGPLATVSRTGYLFNGWFDAPSGGNEVLSSTIVNNPNAHSIYAHWTAATLTVTFFSAPGVFLADKTVVFGSLYGSLSTTPLRPGYRFSSWETSTNQPITSSSLVTIAMDHSLTAFWTETVCPCGHHQQRLRYKIKILYGHVEIGKMFGGWICSAKNGLVNCVCNCP